jgi:hypothetical protein
MIVAIVAIVVVGAVGILLVYEFWAIFTRHHTVSEIVWAAYKANPALGFLVGLTAGLLGGHFFWQ